MAYQNLLVAQEDGIMTITINRPEVRNAMDARTWEEIREAVQEGARDPDVRVLVFTGAGDKAFAAGADIGMLHKLGPLDNLDRQGQNVLSEVEACPKPVIAAINGYALGGGCELALACDIRIASDRAKLGLPEVTLGILPGAGGTQRLTRLVGKGKAKELMFTGDIIDAHEAERIGLVNKVVPHEQLMDAVRAMAAKIMARAPLAVRMVKMAIDLGAETDIRTGLAIEKLAQTFLFGTEDKAEGTAAFLEKRPPRFQGK